MRSKIYALFFALTALVVSAQNVEKTFYGNLMNSAENFNLKIQENCDQIIEIPEDLGNGTFLGGPNGMRVAVDVPVESGKQMTISQIKVSLASANDITFAHFKFHKDNNGVPGEQILEVTNTEIIAIDTLTYVDAQVGYLRTFTLELAEPIVLKSSVATKFWMETVSDARAWGSSNHPIGSGLMLKDDVEDWSENEGFDALYEITADCEPETTNPTEDCDQNVPIPDDLTNGTYLGGNSGNRVAVDVTIDEGTTMTIHEIKVSLAKAGDITFADFKFLSDVNGLPGEQLFEVTDTEIIAEDTLTYINMELGHLRNFTIKLNTPVVLNGSENTNYWMEVVSDARAWGSNPYAEQAIGKGLAMRGTDFEWFELIGIESLYEIHAECETMGTDDLVNSDFNYYPNPVKNTLNISAEKNIKSVLVYNLAGQNIQNKSLNSNQTEINLATLPSGIYVVKAILENGQIETFKIIKK